VTDTQAPRSEGVLVVDHQRASMPVVRSLKRRGHKVVAGVCGDCEYLNWSRFVDYSVSMASFSESPDRVVGSLRDVLAADADITAIFPVDEPAIRFLSEYGDQLPDDIKLYRPAPDVVRSSINKAQTAELCDRLGIPVAPRVIVDNFEDLKKAVGVVGCPLVVRPVESLHRLYDRKVLVVHDLREFERIATDWPEEEHRQLIVQKYVGGNRHNLYWVAVDGRIYAGAEVEALQTTTADATGFTTLAVSVEPDARLTRYCEQLVEALGYHGAGSAQFLLDRETDDITFLEVNPRLDATMKIVEAMHLPMVQWSCDVLDGTVLPARKEIWDYRAGQRLIWLKGENHAYRALVRQGRWGALAARVVGNVFNSFRAVHAVFSFDDPFPAIGCHLNPVLKKLPRSILPRPPRSVTPGPARLLDKDR